MPGLSLVSRQTIYSRSSHQMRRQEPLRELSEEEKVDADESLSLYCKPVALYNVIRRRAIEKPLFLQRCMRYKLQEKHNRRLYLSISLCGAINDGMQTHDPFPFYVLLAKPVSSANVESSAVYHFRRACKLTAYNGVGTVSSYQAKFVVPGISKLSAEVKSGSLTILLISCADITNVQGIDLTKDYMFSASKFGSSCLVGKIPTDMLYQAWKTSPTLSLGGRAEMMSSVSMRSCYMKLSDLNEEKCVSFQFPDNSGAVSILQHVTVQVSAEEIGVKDTSAYNFYSCRGVSYNSLPRLLRLRTGNVVFNYKYYNDMLQRTEVTEDFSCPFCLMKCACFKGVKFHLISKHDLFRFEFWVNEDYQVVNVYVRTDIDSSKIVGVNLRQQSFSFCRKPKRRQPRRPTQSANHVHPLPLDSGFLEGSIGEIDSPNTTRVSSANSASFAEPEAGLSVTGSNLAPPHMLQFAKRRKLSVERSETRNSRALLQKRQFFHSRRAQPMALEQVFAEQDSEDEVDDLEDRRMLDDFMDITQDEKHMMHLWNSFVRKRRVIADGHIPWACESFSKVHGSDFVKAPNLQWCWRLFMVKLWNHGLIEEQTLNNCNKLLQGFQSQSQDPEVKGNISS